MMPGKFIVSFDCEGKWGMADHLDAQLEALLTTSSIERAYEQILGSLARNDIKATFAFVGAFTMNEAQYDAFRERLPETLCAGRPWLGAFLRDAAQRRFEGWLAPTAFARVCASGRHEIGTHGFTHVPLDEKTTSPEIFRREMELVCELARLQGWVPRTLIYPRNQVGHTALLPEYGLIGYRERLWPHLNVRLWQVRSLLAEFGFAGKPQAVTAAIKAPVGIPPGYILNFWHNRRRRLVPREVTRRRWRDLMREAGRTGSTVHLWSHPHNFISDPQLAETFELILQDAAQFVRDGQLRNVTQEECCREVLNSA